MKKILLFLAEIKLFLLKSKKKDYESELIENFPEEIGKVDNIEDFTDIHLHGLNVDIEKQERWIRIQRRRNQS